MSDYLPPLVMELQGRDTSMLKALSNVSEGVQRFAAIVERMGGITTEAAAANSRYARSYSSIARSSTRAAAAIAAVRDASSSTTRTTIELGGAQTRTSASTERLGTQAARTSGLMGVLGAETRRTAERMDAFSGRTARIGGAFASMGGAADGFKGKLKSAGVAAAAIGVGVAAVSVKMAGDFQQETNVLVTAAGEQQKSLGQVRAGILQIARDTGTTWQQLTDGMYQAEKKGYDFAHGGLDVIRAAAQGAREEGAPLNDVVAMLTTVMNNFHVPASKVVQVMNAMKTASGSSAATFGQFAVALPTILPIANQLGVSLEDVAGSLASMTQHGETARHGADLMRGTLRSLAGPSNVMLSTWNQIGLSSVKLAHDLKGKGLSGTLQEISQAITSKMGPAGDVVISTMKKSASATQSLNAMLKQMPPDLANAAKAFQSGKMSAKAFNDYAKSGGASQYAMGTQFKALVTQANGFSDAIKSGRGPISTYVDLLRRATGGQSGLQTALLLTGQNYDTTVKNVAKVSKSYHDASSDVEGWASTQKLFNVQMDQAKQYMETAAVSIGSKLLPIISKVMGFLEKHKTTAKVIAIGIGLIATTLAVAAGAMIAFEIATSPITAVVALVALLAAGFYELYKHFEVVRIGVAVFLDFMKAGFGLMSSVVLHIIKALVDVFLNQVSIMLHGAVLLFSWVPGVGGKLKSAAKSFDGFKNSVDGTFNSLIKKADSFAQASANAAQEHELKVRIQGWTDNINKAKQQLNSLPPDKQVPLKANITQWQKDIAKAQQQINALHGTTVTLTIAQQYTVKGTPATAWHAPMAAKANGGIRKAADGLMSRQAMFASRPILWAEAGPEAYIPLSPGKRARSRSLAEQAVGILGGQVSWGGSSKGAFSMLGAAIPAGVAAGITAHQAAAKAATVALAKATVAGFSQELEIASPSRKFRSLGAYVNFGLVQGLTGTTANVKAATKHIASLLYVDFGNTHKALQRAVAKDNRELLSLAAKRDRVAARLKAANSNLANLQKAWASEQKQVADSIMQSSTVVMDASQNGGWLSASQVVQNFAEQTQRALQFAGFLRQAQQNGLNSAMVQQIASAGVDSGYATAQALASANKDQIRQLNGMQSSMQSAANGVGNSVADSMYKAGIHSAQGLVRGLQSQEKAIQAEMLRIAQGMQKAIKHALGIKSPSRVFAELGRYIPQGLAVGIREHTPHATSAVMSMSAAVAAAGPGTYAGGAGAGSGGNTYVFNVHGSVVTERELAGLVEREMLRKGARRSTTYQPYRR